MAILGKPKPDPELAKQKALAEAARIETLQDDLDQETKDRLRRYGARKSFAAAPAPALPSAVAA